MLRLRRSILLVVSGVAVLAAAGCGSSSGGTAATAGSTTAGAAASSAPAGPPAGGWPQAADGKIDDKFCGIVTAADFATYNRVATSKVITSPLATGGNGINCNYALDDTVTFELYPTAAAATAGYRGRLADHKTAMLRKKNLTSQFTEGLVTGADESWFDVSPLSTGSGDEADTDLIARRGTLIVIVHLQAGVIPQPDAKPAKDTSAGLAALVYQRAPKLGAA
jgi:hypothetical protein